MSGDDDLLFKWRDAFDLATLGLAGGVAPMLHGRAKSFKSLAFYGVAQERTSTSHLSERCRTQGEWEGQATWRWRDQHWGCTYNLGSYAGVRGLGQI